MSTTLQIVFGLLFLFAIFMITRWGSGLRMRSAARSICRELQAKGASQPSRAVPLPYAKTDWLHIGLRDFRPQALSALLKAGVVANTEGDRYWLAQPDFIQQGQNQ